ncbi:hypothetical protein QEZ54_13305 [Catellatospora sp. KI3]|uniref:hypothetical protein n=1 Tax=Catellatospora sp. KI3 TaxID=3041620 RepID=UPI0024822DB7|nr:hypothetical protein [Catellatospora sp. KI3]MDI1461946.1 hypothetical protein [Catellatospora sp. KI3]
MDALARLHPHTAGLLGQVDDLLARCGAPADHPVWPLLRRTGALPGDLVGGLVAWSPGPWLEQAEALRRAARDAAELATDLPVERAGAYGWNGPAADAFARRAGAVRAEVRDWSEQLRADAERLDELAHWLQSARQRAARVLARVASSTQAVALVTGVAPGAPSARLDADGGDRVLRVRAAAAAEIGAALLAEFDALLGEGEELVGRVPIVRESTAATLDLSPSAAALHVDL